MQSSPFVFDHKGLLLITADGRRTWLKTPEQLLAFCGYLVNSVNDSSDLSFFDIDAITFCSFIEAAEHLPQSTRIALAIALLAQVQIYTQKMQQASLAQLTIVLNHFGGHRLTSGNHASQIKSLPGAT